MKSEYHILNLGAGVQSTTLYLMFMQGRLTPPLACAIFADTQEEPAAVYEHLAWLQSLNGPPILIRSAGRLGEDLINGKRAAGCGNSRFATIPAFVGKSLDFSPAIQKRQCSKDYKINVIERTIRREVLSLAPGRRIPKGTLVTQYIGISLDEAGRARRIADRARQDRLPFRLKFPLIENFMTRPDCLTWLARHGSVPHQTPRSACVFCPYHDDHEWHQLKQSDPGGFARAVEIDGALRREGTVAKRGLEGKLYVHRSCSPLDQVEFDTRPRMRDLQLSMSFAAECMGVCGV